MDGNDRMDASSQPWFPQPRPQQSYWMRMSLLARIGAVLSIAVAGIVVVGFVGVFVVFMLIDRNGPPWTSQVTSKNGAEVCTVSLKGSPEDGFRQPLCLDVSEDAIETSVGDLEVGECVRMAVRHPTIVLEREVPCPEPFPGLDPTSTSRPR
jgi:hypothetical protein